MSKQTVKFEQVVERGCGIDVHKKILVATVLGIPIAAYFILKHKDEYKDLGESFLDERRKAKQIEHHMRKLKELGMDVTEAKRVA